MLRLWCDSCCDFADFMLSQHCWVFWGVIWLELNWQNFEIWQWRTFNEFQVNQTFSIPNWDQKEFKKIIRKIFVLIELEMDSFWLDSNFIPKND